MWLFFYPPWFISHGKHDAEFYELLPKTWLNKEAVHRNSHCVTSWSEVQNLWLASEVGGSLGGPSLYPLGFFMWPVLWNNSTLPLQPKGNNTGPSASKGLFTGIGSPGGRGWAVSQFANDHFRQTEITFKWINWCLIFSLLKEAKREIDPSRALNWAMAPMTQEPSFHSGGSSLLPAATWRSCHHPLRSSDFPLEGAQWNLTPSLNVMTQTVWYWTNYLHWLPNRTDIYTQLIKWVNKAGTSVVIHQWQSPSDFPFLLLTQEIPCL